VIATKIRGWEARESSKVQAKKVKGERLKVKAKKVEGQR